MRALKPNNILVEEAAAGKRGNCGGQHQAKIEGDVHNKLLEIFTLEPRLTDERALGQLASYFSWEEWTAGADPKFWCKEWGKTPKERKSQKKEEVEEAVVHEDDFGITLETESAPTTDNTHVADASDATATETNENNAQQGHAAH